MLLLNSTSGNFDGKHKKERKKFVKKQIEMKAIFKANMCQDYFHFEEHSYCGNVLDIQDFSSSLVLASI